MHDLINNKQNLVNLHLQLTTFSFYQNFLIASREIIFFKFF